MPEVTIKYKSEKSLEALKDFSKYFDFEVKAPKTKHEKFKENVVIKGKGVTNETITELSSVFSDAKMDAKELRSAWKRGK